MCIFSVVFYFACVWVSFSASRTDALAADHFNNGSAASFVANEVDAVYVVYNEFKSVMTQIVRTKRLLPIELNLAG